MTGVPGSGAATEKSVDPTAATNAGWRNCRCSGQTAPRRLSALRRSSRAVRCPGLWVETETLDDLMDTMSSCFSSGSKFGGIWSPSARPAANGAGVIRCGIVSAPGPTGSASRPHRFAECSGTDFKRTAGHTAPQVMPAPGMLLIFRH